PVGHEVHSSIVTRFQKGTRDSRGWLSQKSCGLRERELGEILKVICLSLVFAFAFKGKEPEEFVLAQRSYDGSAELLTRVVRVRGNRAVWVSWRWSCASGILLICVQAGIAEESKYGAVIVVGALLGDHIDSGAFGAAVFRREPLSADLEFFHGFQGQLHYGSSDRVVLVIHAVDRNVYVASTRTVHGKYRVALFRGIVAISSLDTWGQVRKVGHVASDHRKFFYFSGGNSMADTRLQLVYKRSLASHFNDFTCRPGFQL